MRHLNLFRINQSNSQNHKYLLLILIFLFMLAPVFGQNNKIKITSDGKLGIGENLPEQKLHVNGSIKADSAVIGTTFFGDQLSIGQTLITTDQFFGSNAFFTGQFTALDGNFITGLSALSANFTTSITAITGNITQLNSTGGVFSGSLEVGQDLTVDQQLITETIHAIDSVRSENGLFESLECTNHFVTQDGFIEDEFYMDGKTFIRDTALVEGLIQTEKEIEFATPQTYQLNISALSFDAQGPFTSNPWVKKENYGYLFQAGTQQVVLNSEITLPDEAIIKRIEIHFYDGSAIEDIDSIGIAIKSLPKSGVANPTVEFENGFASYNELFSNEISTEDFAIPEPGIHLNNNNKMYYVTCKYKTTSNSVNDDLRFYGLTIEYEITKIKGT